MEKTFDQVQEMGSNFFDIAQQAIESAKNVLKPGVDAALPIVKQAGEEALKVASPTISEASKKALEALQDSGIDTEPVLSAAKVCNPSLALDIKSWLSFLHLVLKKIMAILFSFSNDEVWADVVFVLISVCCST